MSNRDTVQTIYQAFRQGDIAAILEYLDDAIEWETQTPVSGVPWLQPRKGRASVPGFFASLAPLQITRFEPHTVFDGGDQILVLIAFEATYLGKKYAFPNHGHLWQFNAAGKIIRYDHVTDTAQMVRMAKGE